jgi:cytoskeletal protein CcmA (bactofilin family)
MLKQEEIIGEIKVAEKNTLEGQVKPCVPGTNAIDKGSKVVGNFVITQDLQVTGDIEGNITGENNANIFVKGSCKGNIRTKGGSVEIEGDMSGGDIVAGGYVKVSGKFHGGKIQARERIYINGEFSGSLESNEVEIGSAARGKGEIFYKDTLCIQKGAKVEGKVTRTEADRKPEPEKKPEQKPEQKPKKGFFS